MIKASHGQANIDTLSGDTIEAEENSVDLSIYLLKPRLVSQFKGKNGDLEILLKVFPIEPDRFAIVPFDPVSSDSIYGFAFNEDPVVEIIAFLPEQVKI